MKILIPMAGKSQRFIDAGYTVPKHLILVEGIPVIEHIVKKFSASDDFVFGCSEDELHQASLLKKIAPKCNIISMPFKKEGPLYGLKIMQNYIQDEEAVVVNYCDFSWVWDYEDFKAKISENNCDGAIVCYRRFHPHLLGSKKYATLDADGLWMKEIKEKYSWHKSKMDDWTSSGTYYFRKGAYVKKYIRDIEKRPELKINNEFYVSQLFQLMKEDGLKIFIYEIPYMLQWGTPEDLEEYLYWLDYFKHKEKSTKSSFQYDMNILMLMAGEGKRFSSLGNYLPKPFIDVGDSPMFLGATGALPRGNKYIFVIRSEHFEKYNVYEIAQREFKNLEIIKTGKLTEGQASTALLAEKLINNDVPLLIGACDNKIIYNNENFRKFTSSGSNIDALIFTFRNNSVVRRNPNQYSWVKVNSDGKALNVSVKNPLSNHPVCDHAVVGSFWFKKGNYYVENAKQMIRANDRVNNEFYIDTCMNYLIKNNLNVYVFEVDKYISWGTPDDIKIYEYWRAYFSKYSGIKSPGIVASLHQEDIFKNLVNEDKFSKKVIGTYPNVSVLQEEGKNNFKKKDFLSIVIPCYNERENLEILLSRVNKVIDKNCMELVIVDNGSSDNTWSYLEMIKDRYKYLKLVKVTENIGYGNGIIQGINYASGNVLAWTHADLQSDPEDVIQAYNLYENISKIEPKVLIKGYRKKRSPLEKFFSVGMQLLASITLGTYFSEINAQPKLFPRALFNNLKDAPNDFSFELYVLYVAKKEGYKIVSLPVDIKKRLYGEAKGGGGSDFKTRWRLMQRTFQYIFELRSKINKTKEKSKMTYQL